MQEFQHQQGCPVGRGVRTTQPFKRDQFVCWYAGELITGPEGAARDNINMTGYRMYFRQKVFTMTKSDKGYRTKQMCIDASDDNSDNLGRLINHSKGKGVNCTRRIYQARGGDFGIFFRTTRDLDIGQELFYDYGEDNKGILQLEGNDFLKADMAGHQCK